MLIVPAAWDLDNFELQLNQLDSVQRDVATLLENGFPPAGQSSPSEGSQSTDAESVADPEHPQDDQALVH